MLLITFCSVMRTSMLSQEDQSEIAFWFMWMSLDPWKVDSLTIFCSLTEFFPFLKVVYMFDLKL